MWDLLVTPGSCSVHPSSSQVQRPLDFLTPNFISIFQFTSISVCVLLCSKTISFGTISVSSVGSGANSHLTHPLSVQALFEKRHHTSELLFCWYFHFCHEGIRVHIAVEEHWNGTSSSLYLENRFFCVFSPQSSSPILLMPISIPSSLLLYLLFYFPPSLLQRWFHKTFSSVSALKDWLCAS